MDRTMAKKTYESSPIIPNANTTMRGPRNIMRGPNMKAMIWPTHSAAPSKAASALLATQDVMRTDKSSGQHRQHSQKGLKTMGGGGGG
eukprot:CAMPEP_0185809078 /NCGR_PEP_ID=MMETSP1322-20130828/5992_1 /TAXON_ID=265543 /ORGANISM="Minutocellus polymorphus, Strain RCC2270" /LENGTH=87 /DNA_ID=CAMNT_0028505327 /DNA_START=184 /DNA_END=447 /DNA_ORIENTATION=+